MSYTKFYNRLTWKKKRKYFVYYTIKCNPFLTLAYNHYLKRALLHVFLINSCCLTYYGQRTPLGTPKSNTVNYRLHSETSE